MSELSKPTPTETSNEANEPAPNTTNAPLPSSSNGPSPSSLAQPANRFPVPGPSVAGGIPKPGGR